ncbi:aldo/keto reductase [Pontibacter rugosus]
MDDPIEETIEAFELLKQQGKIRQYGISSIRLNVIREYVSRSAITSVMLQYSLLDRRPEEEILQLLQEHSIGVLARGSLAQGLLAGKPAKPYLGYTADEVIKAAEAVKAAGGENHSSAVVAAQFVLHHPAITTAVLGIRTSAQLTDALDIANSTSATKETTEYLKEILAPNKYEQHR